LLTLVGSNLDISQEASERVTRSVSARLAVCTDLKRIAVDATLDEALDTFGIGDPSLLFKIKVNQVGVDSRFPGWISVGDRGTPLVLIQANE
jgi:hypothetical protein